MHAIVTWMMNGMTGPLHRHITKRNSHKGDIHDMSTIAFTGISNIKPKFPMKDINKQGNHLINLRLSYVFNPGYDIQLYLPWHKSPTGFKEALSICFLFVCLLSLFILFTT